MRKIQAKQNCAKKKVGKTWGKKPWKHCSRYFHIGLKVEEGDDAGGGQGAKSYAGGGDVQNREVE